MQLGQVSLAWLQVRHLAPQRCLDAHVQSHVTFSGSEKGDSTGGTSHAAGAGAKYELAEVT